MNYPPQINPSKETKSVTNFIQKTFKNANKTTAIVAASGGLDSSTILLLTAKTLSPQNVHVLILPAKKSNPENINHTQKVIKLIQIPPENIHLINIGSIIQKTWRIIKHYLPSEALAKESAPHRRALNQQTTALNRLRLANITARTRMVVIYDTAKKLDSLVVGTENRSEHLLGYFTRFGDEASDLEPLKHLYKTQIRQLAKHLKVPQEIITKEPSADLWPDQTDSKEMGFTYAAADPILYLHFDKKLKVKEIAAQLKIKPTLVNSVLKRAQKNAFKHLTPYSIK